MPLLPSALPPKGEARRYVANDFLNLIALLREGDARKAEDRVPQRGTTLRSGQHTICINRYSCYPKLLDEHSAEFRLFEAVYPWPSACPFSKGRRILR